MTVRFHRIAENTVNSCGRFLSRFGYVLLCSALGAAASSHAQIPSADADAMSRAMRDAQGPMRIILQSSNLKGRNSERPVNPPPPAAAPQAASAAPPPPATSPRRSSAHAPTVKSASPAGAKPARSARANAAQASAPQKAGAAVASDSETPINPPSATSIESAGGAIPAPSDAANLPARRQLLSMVEPDIPQNVLYRLGRFDEVMVEVKIRPDGTVSTVTVLPPAPKVLERYLVSAVQKWRFEAASVDSVMQLQLAISPW